VLAGVRNILAWLSAEPHAHVVAAARCNRIQRALRLHDHAQMFTVS
jgi:hypothetical protein